MRVPLPIALALLLAVSLGVWFAGTRRMDFLTPPSAAKLEITRQLALTALPRSEVQLPSPPSRPKAVDRRPPQRIRTRPPSPAEVADRNPSLDTFTNLAVKGSRHLIELSTLVEASGDRQRTLLVWERVIDSTKPLASHLTASFAAVKRLRKSVPMWSAGHRPIPVVIHVHVEDRLEAGLDPVLDQIAKDLIEASHGVLAPTTEAIVISRKSKSRSSSRMPVTLSMSGLEETSCSTGNLSFTVSKTSLLHSEILRNLFKLAAKQLATDKSRTPVSTPPLSEPPLDSLSHRITRLRWFELAKALNLPKEPPGS